jgi:hypothetical protein
MFRIGHWDLLLIVLVIFILFGHRLPSVMGVVMRPWIRGPWPDGVRFRREPSTLWPTSIVEWLVILMLVGLMVALFWLALAWSD